jgi:hypothetical protein
MWGDNAGQGVVDAITDKKPFAMFDFLHCVRKRHIRDVSKKDALNMPYESVWINVKEKHKILESGFEEMPYISEVFYKDPEDPNGFSPTMDVYPEIKLVNAMQRTIIRAGMKQADPPMVMPNRGFVLPLNFNPAGMNYRKAGTNNDDIQTLPTGNGKMAITDAMIEKVQARIEAGMFVPLFRALQDITKQMTIPEIQQRVADSMGILAPVIGRATNGNLSPMIIRLFNMLARKGKLPAPPAALLDQGYTPIYLSPLAKAQKQSEINDHLAFLGDAQAIGGIIPSVLHNIDEDKTLRLLHQMRGLNPDILRPEEVVKRNRALEAEQQQLMASLEAGGEMADIENVGANTKKTLAEV